MKTKTLGFSLLELTVCLSIIVTISSIAVPALTDFLMQKNVEAQVQSVWRLLNTSRETAVMTGRTIHVCGLNIKGKCDINEIERLAVYEDLNRNNRLDENEQISHETDIHSSTQVLFRFGNQSRSFSYRPTGYPSQPGGVIVCARMDKTVVQKITLQRAGRIYRDPDRDGDGRVEDNEGHIIECE